MKFLLLQTFAWMSLAFFAGAALACLARRLLGAGALDEAVVPAGLAFGTAAATSVPRVAPKAPVIAARTAPAPVTPAAPAVAPRLEAPYSYPITTIGIPRGAPDPIQPQIQNIGLTPATVSIVQPPVTAAAAAAATGAVAAAAKAISPAALPDASPGYPITTIGLPGYVAPPRIDVPIPAGAATGYPVTTVGIPAGQIAANAASAQPAARVAQPRPEPLRPELARATPQPAPVALAPAAPAAPAPAAPAAPATSPGDVPFTPVVASTAALSALAARAQTGQSTVSTAAAPPADVPLTGDDFTRIRSIDAPLLARLKAVGVTRFSQIAKWSTGDVARISQTLGLVGRIEQENWIEQAQILSSGAETEYSRRRQRGQYVTAPVAARPPSPPAPAPSPAVAEPVRGATAMTERTGVFVAAAAAAAAAAASVRTTSVDPPLPARLSDAIRDNAKAAPAEDADKNRSPRPDLSGLRSVRSESLRGDVTAGETQRLGGTTRPAGAFDDLKRIRGIGVLIEKKLNSLGVVTYEQVANWTNADIDRVSQILDFKGRIERESWVEQARILASGGQTDFSKRIDRGES